MLRFRTSATYQTHQVGSQTLEKLTRLLILLVFLIPWASNAVSARAANDETTTDQIVEKYNRTIATEKQKVICRYVRKTGTHFKTRICRTVAQIEREREQAIRDHGDALSGGLSSNSED